MVLNYLPFTQLLFHDSIWSKLNIRVLELEDISAAARAMRWRQGTPMAEARLQ